MSKEEQLDFIKKILEAHTDEGRLMITEKWIEQIQEEEKQIAPLAGRFTWLPVSHSFRERVYHPSILYAEAGNQYCTVYLIHTKSSSLYLSHNLHWLEVELNDDEFVRISKEHLVYCPNVFRMNPYMTKLALISGKILPIEDTYHPSPLPLLVEKLHFLQGGKKTS